MFWFVVSLIFFAAGLVAVGATVVLAGVRALAAVVAVVLFGIGGVILFMDSHTTVPTRTVAVETKFGRPVAVLNNGWHWIAPWADTEQFDASIQTLTLTGDGHDALVRLKNQPTANVDVTVQWRIAADADILGLYRDYKDFGNIETNVVRRQLMNALNEVFETFDPLAAVDANTGASQVQLSDLAKLALPKLQAAMPPGILVLNLTLPSIRYDQTVQDSINKLITGAAATRQAQQQEQTAAAIKAANDQLAGSPMTPEIGYQNCLSMVERVIDSGRSLPAAFSCGAPPTAVVPVK